ncbi:hypothetical protein Q3G72_004600 [Acer saccharum]|nr:hypothetical protein Q3G72_004600 [Acer saccharum]
MAGQNANNGTDLFDAYFRRADLDGDGQISGAEAVAFLQGSNLPKQVLAQVWTNADQRRAGFLNRAEFYNALKLVTVAQSKRELTPDMVKQALYGPASAKIPAPKINLGATATPASQARVGAPAPQFGGTPSPSPQGVGVRGPQGLGSAGMNQQFFPSQPNQFMRPPQAMPPSTALRPQQVFPGRSMPSGGTMVAPRPPTSSVSTDWLGGSTGSSLGGATSQVSSRAISPTTQDGFGLSASGFTPSVQPRPQATSGQAPVTTPKPQDPDSKALAVSGNGFPSDSLFGDVFSATPAKSNQSSWTATSSAGSSPVSTAMIPASPASQPSTKPNPLELSQSTFSQQPVAGQYHQSQSGGKQNQQFAVQNTTAASTGFSVGAVSSTSSQPQIPWPKMAQSDVQKYTKVFVQVDTDRDGKITGEQARNLFLSWRLPREILKQVWDLSDQDNDSMLSLKEFCTALYLMERYREGRPLPAILPSTFMPDEALFTATSAPYASATRGPVAGLQQPQAPRPPAGKPPRPVPIPQVDRPAQPPSQQKHRVPLLEKHLADQLSKEEQNSLDAKLKDATEADKKVEELEKEIITSREKIQFYHTKMQELILYKSRCDNRLNEITERVSGDKREVESLAKKYEEKYKQAGDVASKLSIEESTFRDIQEKKMELYQAIVKMEGDSGNGALQERADSIQTSLEELVKNLNERSKQYGLRAKPTSLVELPFGWQPGVQEGAADWDEDWDKFEDEGFTFVKELTLDVQNVIAPPKPKSLPDRKEMTSTNENALSSNTDDKMEKDTSKGEEITEKELAHEGKENGLASSPPDSPAGSAATESQSKEFLDSPIKNTGADGSPQARDTRSDQDGRESVFSGDKGFDEPGWGTFDANYDTESVWGLDNDNAKDLDNDRHGGSALFGLDDFNLKPIRTDSSQNKNLFPGKKSSIFADSVPSTPAYSMSGSPHRFSAGPDDYSFDKGKSSSIFADSVPSTPAYNTFDMGKSSSIFADSVPSTPAYNYGNSGSEDNSFNAFSRFDSFNMPDFQSPSLSRFDSSRSTRDSDQQGLGFVPKFDSFNAHEGNLFQSSQSSLSRFDSMRSTTDFDHTHGFPSFDDSDPFGSTGPFKTSAETPRTNDADFFGSSGPFSMSSVDQTPRKYDTDPFGSSGPFKTSVDQTPRKSSDNWSAF